MKTGSKSISIMLLTAAATAALSLSACHHVDNRRLPIHYANLLFWTQADWVKYGVSGAGDYRVFDKKNASRPTSITWPRRRPDSEAYCS